MSNFAIEMSKITKTFLNGKVIANKDIDLKVKENEVHALIGENGAGKSTLMSILFGIYNADSGVIKIRGEEVKFSSAKDANNYKLGMVHQHFKLIDEFSILDNVILGDEGVQTLSIIKKADCLKKIKEINEKYNFNLNLNKKIKNCSIGQQQKTEILKLLYRNVDILIFDEPTAVLSDIEIQSFLKMVLDLKKEGKTIIIITHKLHEIKAVANWCTIIRRGEYIADFGIKEKSVSEIAELMVGKKIEVIQNKNKNSLHEETKFEIQNLSISKLWKSNKETKPINLKIKKGEIYAIAGVEGNGQTELALAIMGILHSSNSKILLNGKEIQNKSIKQRYDLGISSVPEDRHEHGVILDMSIAFNTIIRDVSKNPFSKLGFLNENEMYKRAIQIIKDYDVRGTSRGSTNIRLLSGGNQQKLVIGREFDRDYEFLLLVQPSRGMDLGAISFIHKEILNAKEKGKAILLISYELDEIFALADRIAVIQNGEILIEKQAKDITRQEIGQIMVSGV